MAHLQHREQFPSLYMPQRNGACPVTLGCVYPFPHNTRHILPSFSNTFTDIPRVAFFTFLDYT